MVSSKNGLVRHNPRAEILANRLEQATLLLNESAGILSTRAASLGAARFDPRRNYDYECGWPERPNIKHYSELYERDAIANRVVTVYPDECWAVHPEFFESLDETEDTPWEKAVKDLLFRIPVCNYLHRADINSRIGEFGLLVFGFDDGGDLSKPVLTNRMGRDGRRKDLNLLWLQCYDEASVRIKSYIQDPMSPMNGMPEFYQVQVVAWTSDPAQLGEAVQSIKPVDVHWSRCLHVVTGSKRSSEVFAIPELKAPLNRILDLRKMYGGSAEMLWQGGFMGLSIESLPDLDIEELEDEDFESIKKQVNAYMNGLQRYIAVSGMTVKPLSPQVSDPSKHIRTQLEAICACIKVPLRVFLGAESGQLASEQDILIWNKRVGGRQANILEPELVKPFFNRMMAVGALPPVKRYYAAWTDLNALSDKDKADVAMKKAQGIAQYVTAGAETMFPVLEFLTIVMGLPLKTAEAVVAAAKKNKKGLTEKAWAKNKQPAGPQKAATSRGKRPARNSQQRKA